MRRPRPLPTTLLWLALLPSLLLAQGCMVSRQRTELGPLYYRREPPGEPGAEQSAVLWPFFQRYESERVRQTAFRPLLNVRTVETDRDLGTLFEVEALWPLFLYRKTEGPTRLKTRLLPFFFHTRFQHPGGGEETDTALFPFLLFGTSEAEENYFALFPLGGSLRGFFSKDRIRFLLFPLYADTREGDFRARHLLWPFIRYGKGGGRSSFRIWPLVGWKEKEGWYKKFFVLWPFFARVQTLLGTEHPTDSWYFLPFYARQQTAFGKIHYFLYPFFSYQRHERPGHRFREWTLPWPFVRITRGDKVWKTEIWPLWGRRKKPKYANQFVLYPVYRSLVYGEPRKRTHRRYILPFYWSWSLRDEERNELIGKRVKGWPLFDYTRAEGGVTSFRTLSPLWFWRPQGGFERNYSDFWTLYKVRRDPDGMVRRRILWYRWGKCPDREETGTKPGEPGEGVVEAPTPPEGAGNGPGEEASPLGAFFR